MKFKFTKFSIDKLRCNPNQARINVRDTDCRGLCLEVRSGGGKTYYLSYRDALGKQRTYKLANAADISPQQARQLCDAARNRAAMGEDIKKTRNELTVDTPKPLTFLSFFNVRYIPYIKTYKKSWATDVSVMTNHVVPYIGSKLIADINHENISQIIQIISKKMALSSCHRILDQIKFLFNLVVRWNVDGITKNPSADIKLKQIVFHRERYLSAEEVKRLLKELNNAHNPMLKYIIPFLILTGARKTEALTARWIDIDFERRFWRIPFTKNGKVRHVPLSDACIHLLKSVPRLRSFYVFENRRTNKPFRSIYFSWNTARNRAGMPELRIHDLRHSFASFLVNAGCSLYEVQKILGHSQINVTQRYSHLSQGSLLRAAEAAGSVVNPILNQPSSGSVT